MLQNLHMDNDFSIIVENSSTYTGVGIGLINSETSLDDK